MIRIGTRGSELALVQTGMAVSAIKQYYPDEEISIVKVSTGGDRDKDRPLDSFEQKGVFTKEIDELLLNGEIDIAVHSSKDMAPVIPDGVIVPAVLKRDDPRDVFITRTEDAIKLSDIKEGSVIGTSSGRRALQALRINPGVRTEPIRGNVPTRIKKLKDGMYDGIILAMAGLNRLSLTDDPQISIEILDPYEFIPGAGQGIIALAVRKDDPALRDKLKKINHKDSYLALACERIFLRITGGGCKAPCGILTEIKDGRVMISSFVENRYLTFTGTEDQALYLAAKAATELVPVNVSLVGAGPYRADLISEAGRDRISKADVVIYDDLIDVSLLNYAPPGAELIYAGKRSGKHYSDQDEINEMLISKAAEGGRVVRLKGGDPFIFGRGGEEAAVLRSRGIRYEIIPGISSSYSVPELLGVPVTHRGSSSSVTITTGHRAEGAPDDIGTRVFLMGRGRLRSIASDLIGQDLPSDTPAMVIENGASGITRHVTGTLSDIADLADENNIGTPAVTVIGDTVRLSDEIMPDGPDLLHGVRIVLTGSSIVSCDLERRFKELGSQTLTIPLIRTHFTDSDLPDLGLFTHIVFLSRHGVRSFFASLRHNRLDIRDLRGISFAVVGMKTAEELAVNGVRADIVPDVQNKESLTVLLKSVLTTEDNVLIIRSTTEQDILSETLTSAGISNATVKTYETVHDMRLADEFVKQWKTASYVTVTSSSNARAVAEALGDNREGSAPVLVSIGDSTTETLENIGFTDVITAVSHDDRGIVEAVLNDLLERKGGIV